MDIREVYTIVKERFQDLFSTYMINVEGSKDLGVFLSASDFYRAPCSADHHLAFAGGLLIHSYNVFEWMKRLNKVLEHPLSISYSQALLFKAAFFHDLCKVNFYKKSFKWYKGEDTGNKWVRRDVFLVEDTLPLGHGEKSLYFLHKYIDVEDELACAIRWHMGSFDDSFSSYAGGKALNLSWENFPIARVLHMADMMAGFWEKDLFVFFEKEWVSIKEEDRFSVVSLV